MRARQTSGKVLQDVLGHIDISQSQQVVLDLRSINTNQEAATDDCQNGFLFASFASKTDLVGGNRSSNPRYLAIMIGSAWHSSNPRYLVIMIGSAWHKFAARARHISEWQVADASGKMRQQGSKAVKRI